MPLTRSFAHHKWKSLEEKWQEAPRRGRIGTRVTGKDLCGPMRHSIGGAQYYIVYIDDCTRYTEVYFLITKTADQVSSLSGLNKKK